MKVQQLVHFRYDTVQGRVVLVRLGQFIGPQLGIGAGFTRKKLGVVHLYVQLYNFLPTIYFSTS